MTLKSENEKLPKLVASLRNADVLNVANPTY